MYDNYSDIRQALRYADEFRGNSAHGRYVTNTQSGEREYRVYSYSTLIFILGTNSVRYFDNQYYSNTTSRIQNMIRTEYPDATNGHSARVVYDY